MNPRDLEKKAVEYYKEKGYMVERARPGSVFSKGKFVSVSWDFFGAFDGIAVKENDVVLFQACSGTTLSRHKKKVEERFPYTRMPKQIIIYFFKDKGRWKFRMYERNENGWNETLP